jgi:hypothetical protein
MIQKVSKKKTRYKRSFYYKKGDITYCSPLQISRILSSQNRHCHMRDAKILFPSSTPPFAHKGASLAAYWAHDTVMPSTSSGTRPVWYHTKRETFPSDVKKFHTAAAVVL